MKPMPSLAILPLLVLLCGILFVNESVAEITEGYLLSLACGGCHAQQSERTGDFPNISGINEAEFIKIFTEFKSNTRSASIMDRIAKGYDDDEIKKMAMFFARQQSAK